MPQVYITVVNDANLPSTHVNMPTKHKRKRNDEEGQYDLPPNTKARSLPVIAPTKDFLAPRKKQKVDGVKRPKKNVDDTPKVFARLMAWTTQGKKLGSGLDDGKESKKAKKKKQPQPLPATQVSAQDNGVDDERLETSETVAGPKIRAGETLREFSVRVDQSLPLTSLPKNNTNPNAHLPPDLQRKSTQRLTKHNKRLARMQSEWRNTEAKLRAREEEAAEENIEKFEEEKLLWDNVKVGKKRKKGAKAVDDDPWKELEKKRRDAKQKHVRDVVEAPPTLTGVKNMFKERTERSMPIAEPQASKLSNGRKPRLKDELAAVRRAAILEVERRKSSARPAVIV